MGRNKLAKDYRDVLSKRLSNEFERRKDQDYKFTQKQFAKEIGIKEGDMSRYITKSRGADFSQIYKISDYFGCNLEWLIREDVPKERFPKINDIELISIANKLGLDENSIMILKYLNWEGYSKYINELLFNIYDFEELMLTIKNYFDYEKEYDKNPNNEVIYEDMSINKNEIYLLRLRDIIIRIKNKTSIAENKYIRIINEKEKEKEKIKKNKHIKKDLMEYQVNMLNSDLEEYERLKNECEYVKKRFDDFKALNHELLGQRKEGSKHGKK